jgi:hypothetical protein
MLTLEKTLKFSISAERVASSFMDKTDGDKQNGQECRTKQTEGDFQ